MNIDPDTGQTVTGWNEYVVRFRDAVTTPVNHRLKHRKYGCKLYNLQGKPQSPRNAALAAAYIAQCYHNPINNLKQASLISVKAGSHKTGFKITVIVEFDGVRKSINL